MPSVNVKEHEAEPAEQGEKFPWPGYDSEFFWAPYRAASKLLLETHHGAAAVAKINRKFADEFSALLRREQDVILESSEKILNQFSEAKGENGFSPDSFAELYVASVSEAREFGKALMNTQARAVQVLQDRAHAIAGPSARSELKD